MLVSIPKMEVTNASNIDDAKNIFSNDDTKKWVIDGLEKEASITIKFDAPKKIHQILLAYQNCASIQISVGKTGGDFQVCINVFT